MFYPVNSLKRGGRFYLCWVADSWPLRFATITHRQLWSQDIRNICDDLLEVMTNESGRPANRFSLRLSSQLLRGLVRLYQRKVTVLLGDLCMINANVTKNVNKKWNICEVVIDVAQQPLPQLPPAQLVAHEEPENEQRIVEIIQNSGNVVGNIDQITLKESAVPEVLLPPNDGFGEENPEQALQLLKDQTVEMMLLQEKSVHDKSAVQHSGLDIALDVTDKSHDKSRLVTHEAQMEPISELDATMFRKSVVGDERLTMGDLEKEVPEIPEIPLPVPELPVPSEPQMEKEACLEPPPAEPTRPVEETASADKRLTQDIQLEELQQQPPSKRRRLKNKLILDKKIKLTADYLVTRIENPHVELRCEESHDDIVDIKTPVELLFRRPCCAGGRLHSNVGAILTRMYQRNLLSVVGSQPRPDREMEEVAAERTSRIRTRSLLERIEEEAPVIPERIEEQSQQPMREVDTSKDPMNVEGQVTMPMEQVDISELPTQKILITESQTLKRTSEYDVSPKRPRPSGYVSFRPSRQLPLEKTVSMIEPRIDKERISRPSGYVSFSGSQQLALENPSVSMIEIDKENIPGAANIRTPPTSVQQDNFETEQQVTTRKHVESTTARQSDNAERNLTVMLEAAGLADLPNKPEEQEVIQSSATQRVTRRGGSESSETPLGSLDRTKVSLGDSDLTTDSKRFIREQWGTEGTMVKILRSIKAGLKPNTVRTLIAKGPVMAGYKRIMAARCFNSILKLKQHGFIVIEKDLETREIVDILLGPKLSNIK